MRQQKKSKYPNALKHGAFSAVYILPGEDPEEFEALLDDLIDEWQPNGPSELDAVSCIAKGMWHKLRSQRFFDIQLTKNISDPNHPSYDECFALKGLAALLRSQPENAFDNYASRRLSGRMISYLQDKVPRKKFGSYSKWVEAMINEINSVLIPSLTIKDREGQQWLGMIQSAETISAEVFDRDIAVYERLNAMIDRAIKRLIQIKATKQMLRLAPANETKGELIKLPER